MSDETTSQAGTTENTGQETTQETTESLLGGAVQQNQQGTETTDQGTQTETKDAAEGGEDKPYEFVLPEGVEIDKEALALFEPLAKEHKLSNEQAQKLVDVYTKVRQSEVEKHAAEWRDTQTKWVEEIKADQTHGGQHFDQNIQAAQAMIRQYGDDELRSYLDQTGLGNYPPLIRMMMKLGRAAAEDTIHRGGATVTPRTAEQVMYPTMQPQAN